MKGRITRALFDRANRKGFTLVELLVAMVVASAVIAAAYQLFSSTSESMYEVDSLSGTTDKARFALEFMARDVQAAGASATHDALSDSLVHEDQRDLDFSLRGIYAFDRPPEARQLSPLQERHNQATFSDELIILGSLDYPFDFELTFPPPKGQTAVAPNNRYGALRFSQIDPFIEFDPSTVALAPQIANSLSDNMEGRVLRVLDRQGYSQFLSIGGTNYSPAPTSGLEFTLVAGPLGLRERQDNEPWGLEPAGEADEGYQAALLDAYRYRVCIDRRDPENLRLVRERLNANLLIAGQVPPLPDLCDDPAIGPTNFVMSQEPVADRVVDFRVWYDCLVDGTTPTWNNNWMPPGAGDAGHSCPYLDGAGDPIVAGEDASSVRVVHMRLSVRTDRERSDVDNYGFLAADGEVFNITQNGLTNTLSDLENPANEIIGGLQTFDIDGDPSTAARVVTLQLDVSLANFANRSRIQRGEIGDFGL